jgi:hypothetical protein
LNVGAERVSALGSVDFQIILNLETGFLEAGFGSFDFGEVRENPDDSADRGKIRMVVVNCWMMAWIRWRKSDEAGHVHVIWIRRNGGC